MTKKIKKLSRRNMIKSSAAAVGALAGAGLLTGFPAIHASGTPTLRYLGTAVNMGNEPEKKLAVMLVALIVVTVISLSKFIVAIPVLVTFVVFLNYKVVWYGRS